MLVRGSSASPRLHSHKILLALNIKAVPAWQPLPSQRIFIPVTGERATNERR